MKRVLSIPQQSGPRDQDEFGLSGSPLCYCKDVMKKHLHLETNSNVETTTAGDSLLQWITLAARDRRALIFALARLGGDAGIRAYTRCDVRQQRPVFG
jgi:hypothetical protein